jgi:hypothetical protein
VEVLAAAPALGPVLLAFFVFPSDFRRTSAENQRRQKGTPKSARILGVPFMSTAIFYSFR